MELEHTTVKELKLLDSAAREQPVEFDLALPEYYPPVGRILKCFVTPTEEAVTFADGRVSVAGCAAMRLLYADDENRLHCYRTEAKYTKILQTDARDANAAVLVSQDVRTINCRALGPKRVEIKANISVRAVLLGIAETETVSAAGEDLGNGDGFRCGGGPAASRGNGGLLRAGLRLRAGFPCGRFRSQGSKRTKAADRDLRLRFAGAGENGDRRQ